MFANLAVERARRDAAGHRRPIPEIASLRVTAALSEAALVALDSQNTTLPAAERAARTMQRSADVLDALARDTQDLIDRCRNLSITHEALIERLSFRLGIELQSKALLQPTKQPIAAE